MTRDVSSVVLVLNDARFDTNAHRAVPMWLVDTSANAALAHALRAAGHSSVTLLLRAPGESETDLFCRAVENIETHHGSASGGSYARLMVYGLSDSLLESDVLSELSLSLIGREGDAHVLR